MSENKSWIGVDLDGTLAEHRDWKGIEHIGEPIRPMVMRVRHWLFLGHTVKIFTARVSGDNHVEARKYIEEWLVNKAGLPVLEVTCKKDWHMLSLWDDRAVHVVTNTGKFHGSCLATSLSSY